MGDILIVEDRAQEREALVKCFSKEGFSVQSVRSAGEAEQCLLTEKFRLAVLDIGLGDRSGTHVFDVMIKESRVASIIILTGNPSVHLKQRFLERGADKYIVKGSREAASGALIQTAKSLLEESSVSLINGIDLKSFLLNHLPAESRSFFLDPLGDLPACSSCGENNYIVIFSHKIQLPPLIEGRAECEHCGTVLDPKLE